MKISQLKIGATINTGAYSNIQPEITVDIADGDNIDNAKHQAMDHISDLWKRYAAEGSELKGGDAAAVKREPVKCFATGTVAYFDPISHTYVNDKGEQYTSGSVFAGSFEHEFNKAMILPKSAAKLGVDESTVDSYWQSKGDVATTFGTALHQALEHFGKYHELAEQDGKPLGIHPTLLPIVEAFFADRMDEQAMYEAFVADAKNLRCGFIDRLVITGDKHCIIEDYKGLARDTPIPTPLGFTTMGELKEGDLVYGRDGKAYPVKHKSNIHHKNCYKVTFDNGTSVIADHDHRWQVIPKVGVNKKDMVETVLTTTELGKGMKIKRSKPVTGNDIELPIDPYVLGLWLGDGNKHAATITNPNQDIWDEVISRGYDISHDYSKDGKTRTHRIFGVEKHLTGLGLLKNKHLPSMYITASRSQRLDLLRGIFDADGYWNKARKRAVTNTTQEWQRDAVVAIASSLGVKVSIHPYTAKGFGLTKQAWSIDFKPQFNPFLVRNKHIMPSGKTKRGDMYYIKSVERVKTVPTQCIEVDSPDHVYLFGYSYIPTHNTNGDLYKKGQPAFLKAPYSYLPNIPVGRYTLQLSFYKAILEAAGWTVDGLRIHWWNGKSWETIDLKPVGIDVKQESIDISKVV